ncbi:MAG: ABC transporter substrate-binding protein [Candidatus Binatia bacterium]|jgi:4,5-dihydroxyphthalate decarboxylase|nr:ABC transporter substrate-binding protein [Candidatus Binatia bacterium]
MSSSSASKTAALPLTMACGPYDRTEAIRNGIIKPNGIDLTYVAFEYPPDLVDRAVKDNAFDISEMFLSLYLSLRSQGNFPFVAIPVFPSRVFRHGFIFVNTLSGIKTPRDLEGRRVGVPEFRQTAAVWIKGILQHEYNVDLSAIKWVEGGLNVERPRDALDIKPDGPFAIEFAPEGKSLDEMLARGELDACLGAERPNSFGPNPQVQRLFPNYREVEREYYCKTGIFPIMHTLVLKESLYNQHPWTAQSVYKSMVDSKGWIRDHVWATGGFLRFMLPWLWDDLEQTDKMFGGDAWPYGLEPNRHTLEVLMDYMVEQGLMPQQTPLEELFVAIQPEA